ncbi:hypothetical protein Dimus_033875 [Dionaea muscipula]
MGEGYTEQPSEWWWWLPSSRAGGGGYRVAERVEVPSNRAGGGGYRAAEQAVVVAKEQPSRRWWLPSSRVGGWCRGGGRARRWCRGGGRAGLGEVLPDRQRMKVNRAGLAMKTTEQDGRPIAELAELDDDGVRAGRGENGD